MSIVLCVLRSGGPDYGPHSVERLRNSLAEHSDATLVCLSDVPVPCERIPLIHDWRGWWAKMELFRHVFDEPVLYVDLDTTFVDDPAPLFRQEFTMLENAHRPGDVGSGVMSWAGDYSHLYRAFAASPESFIGEYITTPKWGDQGFIRDHLEQKPDFYTREQCASYKVHCTNKGKTPFAIPHPDCRIVYFHGKPRPWDVPAVSKHGC